MIIKSLLITLVIRISKDHLFLGKLLVLTIYKLILTNNWINKINICKVTIIKMNNRFKVDKVVAEVEVEIKYNL